MTIVEEEVGFLAHRDNQFDDGKYLYHYTKWETLLLIAFSKRLRMNVLEKMNDPRESKDWQLRIMNRDGVDTSTFDLKQLLEEFLSYKRKVKILALSEDRTTEGAWHDPYHHAGFALPTMWAHYAGNHTGACLVLDRQKLIERFDTDLLFSSPTKISHGRINYTADEFGGDSTFLGVDAGSIDTQDVPKAVAAHFEKYKSIWFQKHSDWCPEAEYRFVFSDSSDQPWCDVDVSDCVAGLVLGSDFGEFHLGVAELFNNAFELHGYVVGTGWNGPRWKKRVIDQNEGAWTFAAVPTQVQFGGISIKFE